MDPIDMMYMWNWIELRFSGPNVVHAGKEKHFFFV